MGFIRRLFDRGGDPTADWPEATLLPALNLDSARVGDVPFGTPLDQASSLGRPSAFHRHAGDHLELLYADLGFKVEFGLGGLQYAAFFVDHDPSELVPPGVSFSCPVLLIANESREFSRTTTRADIEAELGLPASSDDDPDEIILHYESGALHLEFELHPRTGKLKRLNAFPVEGR